MTRACALAVIALAACGKAAAPPPPPPPPSVPAAVHLAFGDATLSTIAQPPVVELKLHPDGTVELRNERTGQTMIGTVVKHDGLVFMDGQPSFAIHDQSIESLVRHATVATRDGDTLRFPNGSGEVALGSDGVVRVGDQPRWRVDASDPEVARAAFLIYATVIKP